MKKSLLVMEDKQIISTTAILCECLKPAKAIKLLTDLSIAAIKVAHEFAPHNSTTLHHPL